MVLQRPKRLKMLKTFYEKRFTSKQTEPKFNCLEQYFFRIPRLLKWTSKVHGLPNLLSISPLLSMDSMVPSAARV